MDDSIIFLGVRGSTPANGEEFDAYGKHTSCYLVTLDGTSVMVDCGTGVQRAGAILDELPELHLLISHSHLDHIAGLFQLIPMMKQKPLHIYGNTFNGLTIEEQIKRLVGPPIWPVYPEELDREVHYHVLGPEPFSIGPITVETMKSNHPGGCTLYRLDGSGYPNYLTAESLSWPARLITILDIFEALTAADRPYRDSMNVGRALQILEEMVSEGKLDGSILKEYEKSEAWKNADNAENAVKMRESRAGSHGNSFCCLCDGFVKVPFI